MGTSLARVGQMMGTFFAGVGAKVKSVPAHYLRGVPPPYLE